MERDPSVIVIGEDVAGAPGKKDQGFEDAWGGVFKLTKGLIGKFGSQRVLDAPISETGFIGAGVGAAATGLRPIVELMFVGFYGVCADQITNNAAKMHYMFGGKVTLPITIITNIGTGAGAGSSAFGEPLLDFCPLSRLEVRSPVGRIHGQGPDDRCHTGRRPGHDLPPQTAPWQDSGRPPTLRGVDCTRRALRCGR